MSWVITSLLTSLLATVVGYGFTTRKISVVWYHLAGIFIVTLIVSLMASQVGQFAKGFISVRFLDVIVGLTLIAIGSLLITKKPSFPGRKDLLLLVGALQIEVVLLHMHYAQTHDKGVVFAIITSLLLLPSIIGGMVLGQKRTMNWRFHLIKPYFVCIGMILIGLLKMV